MFHVKRSELTNSCRQACLPSQMASGALALQVHCGIVKTPRRAHDRRHHGWVAQLAEQWTENPRVGGSIPPPAIL